MRKALAAILGFMATLAASQATAENVADFYKRQRINLIVGNGTGGGYDIYARVLARHMSSYIPGNPSIIVQNMPGAGGLRAANYIYNVAAKDGTVFGTFARNMPLLGLIKSNQNVQFDPVKFTWLGSSSSFGDDAYLLLVRRDAKIKSIEEARRSGGPPIILGSTAEGASSDAIAPFSKRPIIVTASSTLTFALVREFDLSGRCLTNVSVAALISTSSPTR